jgi:hypothetical protein
MRPTKGPAAAEREIKAQSELVRPLCSEPKVTQKLLRAELRGGRRQRIDVGHLDSTESSLGHRNELAVQLRAGHRRAEPPPAQKRRRLRRRVEKTGAEIVDSQIIRCSTSIQLIEKALSTTLR